MMKQNISHQTQWYIKISISVSTCNKEEKGQKKIPSW
jgi:hypothetical protein